MPPSEVAPQLSARLSAFVAEMPWERESILDFMVYAARSTSANSRVLDVGAGDAPYRELFEHTEYLTVDWENSLHPAARSASVIASADALPFDAASADVVLLTQVLEHVEAPLAVLTELARVLRGGGVLYATVPFVWELHEEPYDFYRFTRYAIESLLGQAGFVDVTVAPRTDSLATLAQLLTNVGYALLSGEEHDPRRAQASTVLRDLAREVALLGPLDDRKGLPLGWTVEARRPSATA